MEDTLQKQQEFINNSLMDFYGEVGKVANEHGPEAADKLVMQFLAQYVGTAVLNALVMPTELAPPTATAAQKFAKSWASYKEIKLELEEAIANGFRYSWKVFAPAKEQEFVCKVSTISQELIAESAKRTH